MKSLVLFIAVAASGIVGILPAGAQDAPAVKVDAKPLKIGAIETPQFTASNVGDRRWRPKSWLELDLEFSIKLPQSAGGRNGSLDGMTVNYYVAFNAKTAEGKIPFIKGTFNYADIPASETCHALGFVAPATLRKVLQKDQFTPSSDIQGWGYEVVVNGTTIAGASSAAGASAKWWESPALAAVDGAILAKKDTPFSILWGDYDVTVKK